MNIPFFFTSAGGASGRNSWILFRKTFSLTEVPKSCEFAIFGDTRYRLIVNGKTVGHGPARFIKTFPEFDTWDIGPLLKKGVNVIGIILNVHSLGAFQSESTAGGLAVGGRVGTDGKAIDFAGPAGWKSLISPAHATDTHRLSFALPPAEVIDETKLAGEWLAADYNDSAWTPCVAVEKPAHGPLLPRSIPPLDARVVFPERLAGAWSAGANTSEDIYSLSISSDDEVGFLTHKKMTVVMCYIHAERAGQVVFGAWWGRYFLNDTELKGKNRHDVPLRQDFTADFKAGWNRLEVVESLHSDWWDFFLALPRDQKLQVRARPDLACPDRFLIAYPLIGEKADIAGKIAWPLKTPEDLPKELGPWRTWPCDRSATTPIRSRAWSRFEPVVPADSATAAIAAVAGAGGRNVRLLYDFGVEVLGRPIVRCDAAAGTIVDVAWTERLLPDGTADIHGRFFVDMMDRWTTPGGADLRWESFHPHGFRYLEISATGDLEKFRLHGVELSRANCAVADVGSFKCSDPRLNKIWAMGRDTALACMEDSYLDCPMRERGLYAGDLFVEFQVNLAAFGDLSLMRRSLELFLQRQGENGRIHGNAFGPGGGGHSDYAALVVMGMRLYWDRSGDTEWVRKYAVEMEQVIKALAELCPADNVLPDASSVGNYIDISKTDKMGINCAFSCFCQKATADAAYLLDRVGDHGRSRALADRAEAMAKAIRVTFWDEKRGVFLDRSPKDVPETEPSVPGCALALFAGIATPEQKTRTLTWLRGALADNCLGHSEKSGECDKFRVNSYFSAFPLQLLFDNGHADAALDFIRHWWGHMLDNGATTCWEFFNDTDYGSRCHAWSACPNHLLSTRVLGVRFPEAGNMNRVRIAPICGDLQFAEGTYPLPAGPLHVRWEKSPAGLRITHCAPAGVAVEIVPSA